LVTLVSPAALDVLRKARARQFPKRRDTEEFLRWLEEAIDQAEAEVKKV
jgi:predicted DNA-binding transcriptional regulator AlpA